MNRIKMGRDGWDFCTTCGYTQKETSQCECDRKARLAPGQLESDGDDYSGASEHVTHLPTDAQKRKAIPLFSGVIKYFPDALMAVAELSRIGNEQHNPGKPLHWDRSKSGDELDALTRHLVDAGTVDSDGVRHSVKVAWRALANLQKEIEGAK